ncbi:MAG TPA: hypothetical protein VNT99_08330 [Methylomirabilota bacterium]|nr:hypothetical protein [Methylomirabilota bacterium]
MNENPNTGDPAESFRRSFKPSPPAKAPVLSPIEAEREKIMKPFAAIQRALSKATGRELESHEIEFRIFEHLERGAAENGWIVCDVPRLTEKASREHGDRSPDAGEARRFPRQEHKRGRLNIAIRIDCRYSVNAFDQTTASTGTFDGA